jgi:DNA-binding transcriptional MerR regulator
MRISDLSRQSGVPVATIKYYLRERLLRPGTPTARNQAEYDASHLQRLRLIRAFTNIGQLDLSSVRELIEATEDEDLPLPKLYEVVNRALFPGHHVPGDPDGLARAWLEVTNFIDGLGWRVELDAPGRDTLAHVRAALVRLGCESEMEFFTPFAAAAERLAVLELSLVPTESTVADRAAAVVRTVLFEVALAALRRLAHEHYLTQREELTYPLAPAVA